MKFSSILKHDFHVVWRKVRESTLQDRVLALAILFYIIYFTLASFLRFDNFYTGRYDLGNMAQAVWNTTQGRILETSDPATGGTVSRLAFHGDFILILLAPFYFLWSSPKLLLLVQTIALALGSVFVYKLSLRVLQNRTISLVFALSFLLSPSVERSNLYDFHAVVLATTFLLGAFYFSKIRRYGWFMVFAFLAGSTKEQVWAVIVLLGLFISFRALYTLRSAHITDRIHLKKELWLGILTSMIAFIFFYLLLWQVIPYFHGKEHFATEYFSDYGGGPGEIIKGILLSPGDVFTTVTDQGRRGYLDKLLLPLGYLSIFSPLYLIFALPDLIINLLSNNTNLQQIYYQYTATITPFLYIAAIYGVRLIRYFFPRLPLAFFALYLLIASCYGAYLYGPLPFSKEENLDMFTKPRPEREVINAYIHTLPTDAKISASNQLGAQLAHRQYLYTIPEGLDKAQYVLLLLSDTSVKPFPDTQRQLADWLKNNPNYILLLQDGDFLVFKRGKLALRY